MTLAITGPVPTVPAASLLADVPCEDCGTNFKYAIATDATVWEAWADKVKDTDTYSVSDRQKLNERKFSSYSLFVKCNAANQNDGCCFKSYERVGGTVCLIRDGSNAM